MTLVDSNVILDVVTDGETWADWSQEQLFIGAHAAVEQRPLLTRDARRYRTYFPTVELITPSESGE